MSISKADSKFEKIILILSLIIFALTFMIYKYRLVPDSGGYIVMSAAGREPLYPFFLFIFRSIFNLFNAGDDAYFYAVSIVQNLLVAYAIYFAVINLRRLFKLNNFISSLIFLIFLAPSFFTIIFSLTGVVMSCSIGTEALTLPLYYIYFTILIKFILEHDIKDYIKAIIISMLLALTRGQMLMLFIINFFAFIAVNKKFVRALLIMLACFALTALISRCYYYITQGYFIGNTYGPITSSSGVFLAGSKDEADLFEDERLRELYIKINDEIEAKGYRENLYDKGILNTGDKAEAAHDQVKFYITGPLIHKYAAETKDVKGVAAEIERDKIASFMMRKLLTSQNVIKNYIKIYIGYLAVGFIRSVAFVHPVLNLYAALVYIIALILFLICVIKRLKREALFMFFALLALTGVVSSVSLVIMPLSRYMIYNLPFLYSSLIICLIKIFYKKELN